MLTREEKNERRRLRRIIAKGELMQKCWDDAFVELVFFAFGGYCHKGNVDGWQEMMVKIHSAEVREFLNRVHKRLATQRAYSEGLYCHTEQPIEDGKKAKQQLAEMVA